MRLRNQHAIHASLAANGEQEPTGLVEFAKNDVMLANL